MSDRVKLNELGEPSRSHSESALRGEMYADLHAARAISAVFVFCMIEGLRFVCTDSVKARQADAFVRPVESAIELSALSSKVCHGKKHEARGARIFWPEEGNTGFVELELG